MDQYPISLYIFSILLRNITRNSLRYWQSDMSVTCYLCMTHVSCEYGTGYRVQRVDQGTAELLIPEAEHGSTFVSHSHYCTRKMKIKNKCLLSVLSFQGSAKFIQKVRLVRIRRKKGMPISVCTQACAVDT